MRAGEPYHFPDGGFDRFITGHVEGQHLERFLARRRAPSAGAVDLVACLRQPLGEAWPMPDEAPVTNAILLLVFTLSLLSAQFLGFIERAFTRAGNTLAAVMTSRVYDGHHILVRRKTLCAPLESGAGRGEVFERRPAQRVGEALCRPQRVPGVKRQPSWRRLRGRARARPAGPNRATGAKQDRSSP